MCLNILDDGDILYRDNAHALFRFHIAFTFLVEFMKLLTALVRDIAEISP